MGVFHVVQQNRIIIHAGVLSINFEVALKFWQHCKIKKRE